MIYAYIRVSTDKQTTENQRFEILKFADEKRLAVDQWVEETISGMKRLEERKLGDLITHMTKDDVLLVTELSRLGRSLMEVMSTLHTLMDKQVKVFTAKERYELGNNINSKVLAFAFSLSAEIERSMISSRTKEALARKMSEGKRLGRTPLLQAIRESYPSYLLARKALERKNSEVREQLGLLNTTFSGSITKLRASTRHTDDSGKEMILPYEAMSKQAKDVASFIDKELPSLKKLFEPVSKAFAAYEGALDAYNQYMQQWVGVLPESDLSGRALELVKQEIEKSLR